MCAARQQDVLAINSKKGIRPMPDTPPFGRYAEIPYDHMTPEQQEGYRSLIETHGQVGGPSKDLGCTTQAGEGGRTARRAFSPRRGTRYRSASARSPSASSTINGIRPIRPTRMSGAARKSDAGGQGRGANQRPANFAHRHPRASGRCRGRRAVLLSFPAASG